jgi:hypothetical protein
VLDLSRKRRPSESSDAARNLFVADSAKDEIDRMLCLGCGVYQQLAIVAKLLQ